LRGETGCGKKHDTILPPAQTGTGQSIEVSTFPVKDSAGKIKGWGYDLSVSGKRTIPPASHPRSFGKQSFPQRRRAQKTGQLAGK